MPVMKSQLVLLEAISHLETLWVGGYLLKYSSTVDAINNLSDGQQQKFKMSNKREVDRCRAEKKSRR